MIRDAVSHVHRELTRSAVNIRSRATQGDADDFVAEDWDVLVLLDACRTDYYADRTPFDGPIETRRSPGSASHEFIDETFVDRDLWDTVYVTPNPHVYMLDGTVFHHVHDCRDAWREDLMTVHPSDMTDVCRHAAAEYPDKRLVCHYMQPHTPYLGETADRIRDEHDFAGWNPDHRSDGNSRDRDRPLVWDLAEDGTITWADVRQAYAETLDIVLEHVQDLVADVDGRVVISADHGELLGERLVPGGPREWAHPGGLDAPQLREVPWHVVQDEHAPDPIPEPPQDRERLDDDTVEDRLVALGYATDD